MISILITGIGGQGTVSLGHLLAQALSKNHIPFVASETHGMSQRGGSVIFHLKIGGDAISPLIEKGTADVILAGEPMEALRAIDYLKPGGTVVTNTHPVSSPIAKQLGKHYPSLQELYKAIEARPSLLYTIPANDIAENIGNYKVSNIVLLGAFLHLGYFPISSNEIKDLIKNKWPKQKEYNLRALNIGYSLIDNETSLIVN